MVAPCDACGGTMMAPVDTSGVELAPGETLVPGSVQMAAPAAEGEAAPADAPESASDAPKGDAPPAPKPDADTDI